MKKTAIEFAKNKMEDFIEIFVAFSEYRVSHFEMFLLN
jgi:hypothetical protein